MSELYRHRLALAIGTGFLALGLLVFWLWKSWFFGGIGAWIGGKLLWRPLGQSLRLAWTLRGGQMGMAIVTGIRPLPYRAPNERPARALRYLLQVPETGEKLPCDGSMLGLSEQDAWRVGDRLEVVYSPADPSVTTPWSGPPSDEVRAAWAQHDAPRAATVDQASSVPVVPTKPAPTTALKPAVLPAKKKSASERPRHAWVRRAERALRDAKGITSAERATLRRVVDSDYPPNARDQRTIENIEILLHAPKPPAKAARTAATSTRSARRPKGAYVLLALTAVGMIFGAREIWHARSSASWPTTEGTVLSSQPLTVEYQIEGETRHAWRRAFGYFTSAGNATERWLLAERYRPGAKVDVARHPSDADLAVIEPGLSPWGATLFVASLLLALPALRYLVRPPVEAAEFFAASAVWLVLCGCGLGLGLCLHTFWHATRAHSWPETPGRVLNVDPFVYAYAVDGRSYRGDAIRFGETSSGFKESLPRLKVREGAPVQVRYSPDDPAKGVLEPGIDPLLWVAFAFALGGAVFTERFLSRGLASLFERES